MSFAIPKYLPFIYPCRHSSVVSVLPCRLSLSSPCSANSSQSSQREFLQPTSRERTLRLSYIERHPGDSWRQVAIAGQISIFVIGFVGGAVSDSAGVSACGDCRPRRRRGGRWASLVRGTGWGGVTAGEEKRWGRLDRMFRQTTDTTYQS